MFEAVELGRRVDKKSYEREVSALREGLLELQFDLGQRKSCAVVLIMAGVDAAGKGDTVNVLNSWMDPRFIDVHGIGTMSEDERLRPRMWRFWRRLPPKGRIGVFIGSWYSEAILGRVNGSLGARALGTRLAEINRFERMLADEGVVVLKLWLHLSKQQQKARLRALAADQETRWRASATDWAHYKLADAFQVVNERILRETSTPEAPWTIIEANDWRYRNLAVGRALLAALRARSAGQPGGTAQPRPTSVLPAIDNHDILDRLDLSLALSKKEFEQKLEKYQGKLNLLARKRRFGDRSVVVVFEGCDAAGKGGAIRRITGALDARAYRIVPIAAPSEEERAQPYLWRFWRQLPRRGEITIFDRSWYGRVLVERVEGFCSEFDWKRAYSEINDFEEQLHEGGAVVVKFWLQISKQEQLRRFKDREVTPFKRFKITEEDWRNRRKWNQYRTAVCDLVARTSTDIAPWTLVEAEDKNYARIKVLRTLCKSVEAALDEK